MHYTTAFPEIPLKSEKTVFPAPSVVGQGDALIQQHLPVAHQGHVRIVGVEHIRLPPLAVQGEEQDVALAVPVVLLADHTVVGVEDTHVPVSQIHAAAAKHRMEIADRSMEAMPHRVYNRSTRRWEEDGSWTFNAANAIRALTEIGKYLGVEEKSAAQEFRVDFGGHEDYAE